MKAKLGFDARLPNGLKEVIYCFVRSVSSLGKSPQTNRSSGKLVAVLAQSPLNHGLVDNVSGTTATQIAAALFAGSTVQVAGPSGTVHDLASCGQTEAFLNAFVCFHFRHDDSNLSRRRPTVGPARIPRMKWVGRQSS